MIRPRVWVLQHILESKPKLNKMFMVPTDEWSLISYSAVYEVRAWRRYLKMWQRIMKPRHWKWHSITYRNAVQYTVSIFQQCCLSWSLWFNATSKILFLRESIKTESQCQCNGREQCLHSKEQSLCIICILYIEICNQICGRLWQVNWRMEIF